MSPVTIPPAWELSATQAASRDAHVVDLFFRVHEPHYSREGLRHVITIPAAHTSHGHAESYISEPGRDLADFCCDITLARETLLNRDAIRPRAAA